MSSRKRVWSLGMGREQTPLNFLDMKLTHSLETAFLLDANLEHGPRDFVEPCEGCVEKAFMGGGTDSGWDPQDWAWQNPQTIWLEPKVSCAFPKETL